MDPQFHTTTGYGAAVQDPGILKPRMCGGQGVLFGHSRHETRYPNPNPKYPNPEPKYPNPHYPNPDPITRIYIG
jgi:hypothetical protein